MPRRTPFRRNTYSTADQAASLAHFSRLLPHTSKNFFFPREEKSGGWMTARGAGSSAPRSSAPRASVERSDHGRASDARASPVWFPPPRPFLQREIGILFFSHRGHAQARAEQEQQARTTGINGASFGWWVRHVQGVVARGWMVRGSQALEAQHVHGVHGRGRHRRLHLQLLAENRGAPRPTPPPPLNIFILPREEEGVALQLSHVGLLDQIYMPRRRWRSRGVSGVAMPVY